MEDCPRTTIARHMKISMAAFLALAGLSMSPMLAETNVRTVRFESENSSKVRIEGTTNVHDWQAQGNSIKGWLEAGRNFPFHPGQVAKPGSVEADLIATIPVESLKSIDRVGNPYNAAMDQVLHDRLGSGDIVFRLDELAVTAGAKPNDSSYPLEGKGQLAIHGTTNTVVMPVRVRPMTGEELEITGQTKLKMSDYAIEPWSPRYLPVVVGDEVTVRFTWILHRKGA